MARLSVPTLLLALAFAAMAGPAAADGSLLVGSMVHDGMAAQSGELAMLFVYDVLQHSEATPWISGSAASVVTTEYTKTRSQVEAPLPEPFPPVFDSVSGEDEPQDPVETRFTLATFRLAGHQSEFEAHAFPTEGLLPFTAISDDRQLDNVDQMFMGPGDMGPQPGAPEVQSPNLAAYDFSVVERSGPLVLQQGESSRTEMVLRGSFVLELYGLSLDLVSDTGQKTVESGVWKTPVVDGQGNAYNVRETLVRVFLEDAEVTIAVDGGLPVVQWATANVQLQPSGLVTFYNSHGAIGDQVLDNARYVLEPGSVLGVAPQADGLQVEVSDAGLGPHGGTIADVPAPASAALIGSGAVLALLVAIGIGLLRRVLRMPQLAEVERAIEEGEYRRAARLAGRILARRPDDESAVLARGIALSKAGQPQRTVRELSDHLSRTTATDGSLHYVLGLAQLDLGQREAGRASLREAVRLTPSLQAEVAPRLGKAFSSPAPTTKETSAYA